jgi:hypothetical protein
VFEVGPDYTYRRTLHSLLHETATFSDLIEAFRPLIGPYEAIECFTVNARQRSIIAFNELKDKVAAVARNNSLVMCLRPADEAADEDRRVCPRQRVRCLKSVKAELTEAMPFCITIKVTPRQNTETCGEVLGKMQELLELEEKIKVYTCTLHQQANKNLEFFRLKPLEDTDSLFDDANTERHLWVEYPSRSQQTVHELKIKIN